MNKKLLASIQNLPFFLEDSDMAFGKRLAVHEFIGNDNVHIQELGRANRSFTLNCFVNGDDYIDQIKKIVIVCEKSGTVTLSHPTFGIFTIEVKKIQVRDNDVKNRISRFSIDCIDAGQQKIELPIELNTLADVFTKRESALITLQQSFTDTYDIDNKTFAILDNLSTTFDSAIESIRNNRKSVNKQAYFIKNIQNTTTNKLFNLQTPNSLSDAIFDLITFGSSLIDELFDVSSDNSRTLLNELIPLFEFTPNKLFSNNISDPSYSLQLLIQYSAVITSCGLLAITEYDSVNDAFEMRNIVLNKIDSLSMNEQNINIYDVMQDLRSSVVNDIDTRSVSLERINRFTMNNSLPSIILCNYLYGALDNETDIIDRNKVVNPFFISGGIEIEVKSDGK